MNNDQIINGYSWFDPNDEDHGIVIHNGSFMIDPNN